MTEKEIILSAIKRINDGLLDDFKLYDGGSEIVFRNLSGDGMLIDFDENGNITDIYYDHY